MITHIEGNVCELTPTYVVLDSNGIGYFKFIFDHFFKIRIKYK